MIILLILFTLSFGVVFEKGNLYYSPEKVGDNGILIHNFKNYDDNLGFLKSQKITNFNQIVDNVTNTNTQFTSIPSEGFDDLKTTSALTQEERRCRAVLDSYNSGLFALYGYTAKAVEDADITPSITALIKSGPSQVQYLNVPSDYSQVFKDYNVTQQCNDEQYELSYGLSNKGVIDSQCIPNTDIPEDTSRCIGSGVEYQTHLKGFREGYFYYGDERMVKDLIIRFGVVISYPGVMIGWQYRKWIIVDYDSKGKYQLNSVDISASSYYEGTVLFNELNYHKDGISGGIIAVIIIVVVAVVGAALILFIILYLMYQRKIYFFQENKYKNEQKSAKQNHSLKPQAAKKLSSSVKAQPSNPKRRVNQSASNKDSFSQGIKMNQKEVKQQQNEYVQDTSRSTTSRLSNKDQEIKQQQNVQGQDTRRSTRSQLNNDKEIKQQNEQGQNTSRSTRSQLSNKDLSTSQNVQTKDQIGKEDNMNKNEVVQQKQIVESNNTSNDISRQNTLTKERIKQEDSNKKDQEDKVGQENKSENAQQPLSARSKTKSITTLRKHRFANTTQNKDQNIDDKGNKQEIGKQQKDVGQSSTERKSAGQPVVSNDEQVEDDYQFYNQL